MDQIVILTSIHELPERCGDCPCHNGESGYCQADREKRDSEWRPFWCPLKYDDRKVIYHSSQMAELGH